MANFAAGLGTSGLGVPPSFVGRGGGAATTNNSTFDEMRKNSNSELNGNGFVLSASKTLGNNATDKRSALFGEVENLNTRLYVASIAAGTKVGGGFDFDFLMKPDNNGNTYPILCDYLKQFQEDCRKSGGKVLNVVLKPRQYKEISDGKLEYNVIPRIAWQNAGGEVFDNLYDQLPKRDELTSSEELAVKLGFYNNVLQDKFKGRKNGLTPDKLAFLRKKDSDGVGFTELEQTLKKVCPTGGMIADVELVARENPDNNYWKVNMSAIIKIVDANGNKKTKTVPLLYNFDHYARMRRGIIDTNNPTEKEMKSAEWARTYYKKHHKKSLRKNFVNARPVPPIRVYKKAEPDPLTPEIPVKKEANVVSLPDTHTHFPRQINLAKRDVTSKEAESGAGPVDTSVKKISRNAKRIFEDIYNKIFVPPEADEVKHEFNENWIDFDGNEKEWDGLLPVVGDRKKYVDDPNRVSFKHVSAAPAAGQKFLPVVQKEIVTLYDLYRSIAFANDESFLPAVASKANAIPNVAVSKSARAVYENHMQRLSGKSGIIHYTKSIIAQEYRAFVNIFSESNRKQRLEEVAEIRQFEEYWEPGGTRAQIAAKGQTASDFSEELLEKSLHYRALFNKKGKSALLLSNYRPYNLYLHGKQKYLVLNGNKMSIYALETRNNFFPGSHMRIYFSRKNGKNIIPFLPSKKKMWLSPDQLQNIGRVMKFADAMNVWKHGKEYGAKVNAAYDTAQYEIPRTLLKYVGNLVALKDDVKDMGYKIKNFGAATVDSDKIDALGDKVYMLAEEIKKNISDLGARALDSTKKFGRDAIMNEVNYAKQFADYVIHPISNAKRIKTEWKRNNNAMESSASYNPYASKKQINGPFGNSKQMRLWTKIGATAAVISVIILIPALMSSDKSDARMLCNDNQNKNINIGDNTAVVSSAPVVTIDVRSDAAPTSPGSGYEYAVLTNMCGLNPEQIDTQYKKANELLHTGRRFPADMTPMGLVVLLNVSNNTAYGMAVRALFNREYYDDSMLEIEWKEYIKYMLDPKTPIGQVYRQFNPGYEEIQAMKNQRGSNAFARLAQLFK